MPKFFLTFRIFILFYVPSNAREMRPIATDDSVAWCASQSVCHAPPETCKNSWMDRCLVWSGDSWWPKEHVVLDVGPDPPTARREKIGENVTLPIKPYINTTVPTHSPDGGTFNAAINKYFSHLFCSDEKSSALSAMDCAITSATRCVIDELRTAITILWWVWCQVP